MDKKVFEELKKIIKSRFNKDVSLTTKLDQTGIDSLDLLDLVVEVEKKYNVTVTDEELVNMKTINDVVKSISSKLS